MTRRGRPRTQPTDQAFDLLFLRDLKHRLRMMLRDIEKLEKVMKKSEAFERQAKATPQQVEAALNFYKTLALTQQDK